MNREGGRDRAQEHCRSRSVVREIFFVNVYALNKERGVLKRGITLPGDIALSRDFLKAVIF